MVYPAGKSAAHCVCVCTYFMYMYNVDLYSKWTYNILAEKLAQLLMRNLSPARQLPCSSSVGTMNWSKMSSSWTSRRGLAEPVRVRLYGRNEGKRKGMRRLGTSRISITHTPNIICVCEYMYNCMSYTWQV